jgi:hypothetical protein
MDENEGEFESAKEKDGVWLKTECCNALLKVGKQVRLAIAWLRLDFLSGANIPSSLPAPPTYCRLSFRNDVTIMVIKPDLLPIFAPAHLLASSGCLL